MLAFLARMLQKPWVRKLLILAGAIVAFFLVVNYVALPLYVNREGTLPVPNVTGTPLEEAKETLAKAGLEPVEADTRPDPEQPVGTVVFQNPGAQSIVKSGRRVYLTISGGEVRVSVPQLRGRSLREAKFALERYGLKLGGISFEQSKQFPENTIVAQSVPVDSRLPKGSKVAITVSSGSGTGGTVVPNVVGRTVTEAERILQSAGLKAGNVTYRLSYELIPNTVVEQFPRAGESVTSGQNVDLFVIKAGKPTEEIQVPKR